MKVLTITPNPALDINGVVDSIKPDEKAYVHDEQRNPGGNAINVARILHRLGVSVTASGLLGGPAGAEIRDLLKEEKVPVNFVAIKEPTRTNITISNRGNHRQTRLSFPGPQISASEKAKLRKIVSAPRGLGILVIGGSLPPGFSPGDLKSLIRSAQKKKMEVVVDCPGPILSKLNSEKVLLIKPNLEEFHAMTKSKVKTIAAVKKKAQGMLKRSSFVCISSVDGGALLVSENGSYFGRIAKVKIRSTVGAGDSMVAAMVSQFSQGNKSPEDILRWGLAASAATLTETGTQLGSAALIKSLYKKTKVYEV